MTNETKKTPIHKISVGNGITASIWENVTEEGKILHAVEVERRYQPKGSDTWETSTSYVSSQILLVSQAFQMAFAYIGQLKATESAS